MKSRWALFLVAVLSVYIFCSRISVWTNTIVYDKFGYYLYLPAAFIYHDLDKLDFRYRIMEQYNLMGGQWYDAHKLPNGNTVDKYAIGTAVLEMPFFLLAHVYANNTDNASDGFSMPYQVSIAAACLFWVMFGLFLLRSLLRKYFSDNVVTITLLCTILGTNLLVHTVTDTGLSHPFSFFLFSALLYYTDKWYSNFKPACLYMLGFIMGLIIIVRPVNIIAILLPLLWGMHNKATFKKQTMLLSANIPLLLKVSAICFAVVMLQLSYWKYVTGSWVYFSYGDEGFNFLKPHIWDGLFSWRKGWFIYTPIALLGVAGLYALWQQYRQWALSVTIFFVVFIYVVFSWECWWYGGSFSSRPMIEALAILAMPMACFYQQVAGMRSKLPRVSVGVLTVLLIALNLFQTYQFANTTLPYDRMTRTYYFKIFGKPTTNQDELRQYLMSEEEARRIE